MGQNRQPTGRANYLRSLAGIYLVYLGGKMLYNFVKEGPGGVSVILQIVAMALFLGVGGLLLWGEWKAFRFAQQHKDDPTTWSDDFQQEEDEEDVEILRIEDDDLQENKET